MATIKQKKALENIIENHGNVSKAMRDAGYSENTAKNPSNLTESKGFEELLEEYLPDDLILKALREDIQNKPGERSQELNLASKIKGYLKDKGDSPKININPEVSDDELKKLEAKIKEGLSGEMEKD